MLEFKEEDLLSAFIRNEEGAFSAFYDRYSSMVFQYLLAYGADRDTAADLVQNLMLDIVKQPEKFSSVENLPAYLILRVKSRYLDSRRSETARDRREKFGATTKQTQDQPEELDQSLRDKIGQALSSLPEPQRVVVRLRIYGNMTLQAISTMEKVSLGTIASRYRHGIEKLRNQLKHE